LHSAANQQFAVGYTVCVYSALKVGVSDSLAVMARRYINMIRLIVCQWKNWQFVDKGTYTVSGKKEASVFSA